MLIPHVPTRRLRLAQTVVDPCSSGWSLTGWGGAPVYSSNRLYFRAYYSEANYQDSASKLIIPAGDWRMVEVEYDFHPWSLNGGAAAAFDFGGYRVAVDGTHWGFHLYGTSNVPLYMTSLARYLTLRMYPGEDKSEALIDGVLRATNNLHTGQGTNTFLNQNGSYHPPMGNGRVAFVVKTGGGTNYNSDIYLNQVTVRCYL